MANLTAGDYWILSAANTKIGLDVAGASRSNGANIRMYTHDPDSDGQVYDVSIRSNGTYQILARFSGKAIDVANAKFADNTNVQQNADNDKRQQSWDIVDSGTTVSYGGKTYPAYYVSCDKLEVRRKNAGFGSVVLNDSVPGRSIESLDIEGIYSDGNVLEGTFSVGTHTVELPTYLAALPSGVRDIGHFTKNGFHVERNVGKITEYDEVNDFDTVGNDYYCDSESGELENGCTVYYRLLEQSETLLEEVELVELERDDTDEPLGMSTIEMYPTVMLPTIDTVNQVISLGVNSYINVDYWGEEASSSTLYMTASSTASQADVRIRLESKVSNANLRKWIFVPIPAFTTGACYEIHSEANTKLTLSSNGTSNGANVYVLTDSNSNTQRWIVNCVDAANNKWTIQNVQSRYMLDVAGGKMANGTNVQIYKPNNSNAQYWCIEEYNLVTFEGQSCQVVKFVPWNCRNSATRYVLDVNGASKSVANKSNVCLYAEDNSTDQRWIMVKTTAIDSNVAAPTDLSSSQSVKGGATLTHGVYNGRRNVFFYVQAADNWLATNSANNYQFRWRYRYMDSDTGSWGSWGAYTAWKTLKCTIVDYFADVKKRGSGGWNGEQAWTTDPIPMELTLQDHEDENGKVIQGNKAVQIQYGCRCVGAGAASNVVSKDVYQTITGYYAPAMKLDEVAWTPSGYNVRFLSDYNKGAWGVTIKTMTVNGSSVISKDTAFNNLYGSSGTCFITTNGLGASIPNEGSTVKITWTMRTDLSSFGIVWSQEVPLVWNSGHGEVAQPRLSRDNLHWFDTFTVDHKSGAKVRMWARWYSYTGWKWIELTGTTSSTSTKFTIAAPERSYLIWTTVYFNNDEWASNFTKVPKNDNAMPMHMWSDSRGVNSYAVLFIDEKEMPTLKGSIDGNADTVSLNKRPYETVRFPYTKGEELTVEGICFDWKSDDKDGNSIIWAQHMEPFKHDACCISFHNVRNLVGRHCVYRSPYGDRFDVAVTKISYTKHGDRKINVSITMTIEGA